MRITVEEAIELHAEPSMETCGCEDCGGGIPRPPDTCCNSLIPDETGDLESPVSAIEELVTIA